MDGMDGMDALLTDQNCSVKYCEDRGLSAVKFQVSSLLGRGLSLGLGPVRHLAHGLTVFADVGLIPVGVLEGELAVILDLVGGFLVVGEGAVEHALGGFYLLGIDVGAGVDLVRLGVEGLGLLKCQVSTGRR